ncbi:hypothetical protein EDB84DRAFT_1562677 [Lactarius hengduanensis]|nr:hypothetical protein EDB84DRAFT_1562677 [Lactarius hengduanensis]
MEEDLDYALERPSRNPPHSRFTFPVTPPRAVSLAALAERPAMAPLPVPLIDPSPALVEPTPAPPVAAPVDALAQLTAAITATISRLEAKLEAGLEAQSKRIDALLNLSRSTTPGLRRRNRLKQRRRWQPLPRPIPLKRRAPPQRMRQ